MRKQGCTFPRAPRSDQKSLARNKRCALRAGKMSRGDSHSARCLNWRKLLCGTAASIMKWLFARRGRVFWVSERAHPVTNLCAAGRRLFPLCRINFLFSLAISWSENSATLQLMQFETRFLHFTISITHKLFMSTQYYETGPSLFNSKSQLNQALY